MARTYICKGECKQKYPLEEMVDYNGNRYCKPCLNKFLQKKADRQELHQTIRELYNIDMPTGKMLKEIKVYEENGLTLKGMTLTLKYCKLVKNYQFHYKYGLALISHFYEDAKNDYIKKKKQAERFVDVETKTETVYISGIKRNPYKNKRLVNMEDLI